MIQFTIDSFSGGSISQLRTLYKTVGTPYGATKRLKKHSASGTARKRTLKGIAKTTFAKS